MNDKKKLTNLLSVRNYFKQRRLYRSGIFYGLVFGIVGNIMVSHYYAFFNRFVLTLPIDSFIIDTAVFSITLSFVLWVGLRGYLSLRADYEIEEKLKDEILDQLLKGNLEPEDVGDVLPL